MLHIGICDDDPVFISFFSKSLRDYCEKKAIEVDIKMFSCPEEILVFVESKNRYFDIIFLDIDMPSINGHVLAERLRLLDTNFELVFVTSHRDRMQTSFRFLPRDFIFKSELESRLTEVMPMLISYIQKFRKETYMLFQVSANHPFRKESSRFFYIRAPIKDIRFVEIVAGTMFIDISCESYILKGYSFSELSESLIAKGFILIYRATVVNPEHIQIVEQKDILLLNGDRLRLSRYMRKDVENQFSKFVRDWRP